MIINEVEVEVERKPIKHIHLSVYPPYGRVHVSAPEHVTDAQLRLFVLSKWTWVAEKREQALAHAIQPMREYINGEAHYFMGGLYRLFVDEGNHNHTHVSIEGDYIVVHCLRQEYAGRILREWYREELKKLLPPIVERWAERVGVPKPAIDVLDMKLRWGSCNRQKRAILFNLELAKKPLECIEYVAAHEVIHLIERNHTARFFRLLDTYLPQWERLRKELNELPITP